MSPHRLVASMRPPAPLCGCGCGLPVRWGSGGWRRFLNGHHRRMPAYREQASAALERAHGTATRNAEIRRRVGDGEAPVALAREFGVSTRRIFQIVEPLKTRARLAVHRAIGQGRLTRPDACQRCGDECTPEAHHADYARELDVQWLCRSCHIEADRERSTGAADVDIRPRSPRETKRAA